MHSSWWGSEPQPALPFDRQCRWRRAFARQVYPLVVHLPLTVYLCARYRLSPLLAALGVTSAYLSCQFSNWMGIAAFAATDSQIAYYLARIATTLGVFAVLLHWAGDIDPAWRLKAPPS